jgi:negative elongation factor C/D
MLADLANGGDAGLGGETSRATQSSAFATRVSQELRFAAAEAHGAGVVRRVAPLLAASDADARAATVVGDLLQAADDFKKRKNTSAHALAETTRKLRAMYLLDDEDDASQRVENFEKPSTAPIRAPELLRALLDEAFRWDPNADPKRNAENRARCFDLIAFATCGEDEFRETRAKLLAVFEWCAGTTRGVALCLEEGSSPFLETITHPVPAAGALAWVKSAMGNPEHYKQVHAAANTAAYLHVVSEICKAHVRLRLEALETVTAAIAAMGKGANEQTHLATLDVAVELVEHGLVLPALRAATDKWRRDVDPSHLRYFAGEVLEVAGPPYSGAFAAAALELLRAANAGKGMTRACDEFVEQCRRQRARGALQPPLSKDLDEVLDRLAGSGAKGR